MITPSKVILLIELGKFPFNRRFFGSMLLVEKLNVMMLVERRNEKRGFVKDFKIFFSGSNY